MTVAPRTASAAKVAVRRPAVRTGASARGPTLIRGPEAQSGHAAAPRRSRRPPASRSASTREGPHVAVWLPYWDMQEALAATLANAWLISSASPFWYELTSGGAIEDDPGAGERAVVEALHGQGIRIIPTVTEEGDMREFDRSLSSASQRASMVRALSGLAEDPSYGGLDLDFENFAVDRAHNSALADAAAERYPGFVAEVCSALHAIDRSCTVTIMARTSERHVYWRGRLATWVYDYRALGQVADRVRIMAYDDHAPGTAPGPIAPYGWVRRIIAYASATIPAEKVELALPVYGYDWSRGSCTAITARQAQALAGEAGTSASWSERQQEEVLHYGARGHRHTVWFEGARATGARARLEREAGFAGIDLWAPGGEDSALWPLLQALFER